MIRNVSLRIAMVVLAVAAAAPSLALAASGGASISSDHTVPSAGALSVTGGGITLTTRAAALLGRPLRIAGTFAGPAGRTIVVQSNSGTGWAPVATTSTAPTGTFVASWRPNHLGTLALRAVPARSSAATPPLFLTVYRPAVATVFGPGLFGRSTACGAVLRRRTLGVANRTLPCGTPVAFYYRGRTIVVPVIDRGPYAHGANWDLTQATANVLGVSGIATVGAVPVAH